MDDYRENWEDLANAIIISAVKEYKRTYKQLLRNPRNKSAQKVLNELEQFFYGRWYAQLTDLDPHYLLERLKEAIENDRLELLG